MHRKDDEHASNDQEEKEWQRKKVATAELSTVSAILAS
jgi:hypothetical protein